MKKPALLPASNIQDRDVARSLSAVKGNLDIITGAVGGELVALLDTASTADVIGKINEIIRRLNRSGT